MTRSTHRLLIGATVTDLFREEPCIGTRKIARKILSKGWREAGMTTRAERAPVIDQQSDFHSSLVAIVDYN